MARRVYSDFDAELLLRLANRTDITSTQRGFFLNDGYLKVCNIFQHVQLQGIAPTEVVAQSTDFLIPSVTDLWYPRMVKNLTNGYIIRQEQMERAERAQTKPTSPPYTYYWWGGQFYFESFADTSKILKVWYKKIPPEFTVSSPVIDQIFDPLIVMYAAEIGLESVRDLDQAGKEAQLATKYAREHKLPLDDAKLNDYRTGFKVRLR